MPLILLIGITGAAAVAIAAARQRMLTPGGAFAAAITGGIVFTFGGGRSAALLLLFFLSSSLLTKFQASRKPHPEHRGGRTRNQVLANGTAAALAAIWYGTTSSPVAFSSFAGAVAAATADTWATEVGLLSRVPPRLISTGEIVSPGRSGGVTWLGSISGLLGAAMIGIGSGWAGASTTAVALAGIGGMLIDSVLGATVEGRWSWMNNDTVNLISTTFGAAVAGVLSMWL